MKLSGLFSGENQIADTGKTQVNYARFEVINRQIQAMTPGQTIQGEVVSREGNEVQIQVAEDMVLQAKLDRNMNLDVGMYLTFEVKNNGKALLLSPLFTNMATDANVQKALDMAALPMNGTTVAMTKQLMEAGLSIDKNTLQQVYREVNMFPEATSSDIVNLHKMQMPVNADNVSQMASYRNLTHQLVTGLNHVLDAIPEVFSQMAESGDAEGMIKLYRQLEAMVQEQASGDALHTESVLRPTELPHSMGALRQEAINPEGTFSPEKLVNPEELLNPEKLLNSEELLSKKEASTPEKLLHTEERNDLQEELLRTEEKTQEAGSGLPEQNFLHAAETANHDSLTLLKHFLQKKDGKDFLEPLLRLLKEQWTITPEEVSEPEQVESLYGRIHKQLRSLAQTLEDSGQGSTAAYKAVTNINQNLDFMQQINQIYTYVQLPLRLQQGDAHGDLYVYTNKKHLASKEGKISALLHLDMEHLGTVDVYVSMLNDKVNTKFYLQDDEMLDFLTEHMDILTQRLAKRGYQCSCEMQLRQQGEEAVNDIRTLLQREKQVAIAEYAFDVRT